MGPKSSKERERHSLSCVRDFINFFNNCFIEILKNIKKKKKRFSKNTLYIIINKLNKVGVVGHRANIKERINS